MGVVTAKELKNRTGEILRRVRSGEKILITRRGKPCAMIEQPKVKRGKETFSLRSFDAAWKDILYTLKSTEPKFKNWKEAMKWTTHRTILLFF